MELTDLVLRRKFYSGKPTEVWGHLTLALGLLSLIPVTAPLFAGAACASGAVGAVLASRRPERYAGRRRILLGLLASLLGMGFFFLEAEVVLRYKVSQEYDQRLAISRFRMEEIQEALEEYRQVHGVYPDCAGIFLLREELEPKYIAECPVLDGFDVPFSFAGRSEGYALTCFPPPRGSGGPRPAPIVLENRFLSAPGTETPQLQGPPVPPGLVRTPGEQAPTPPAATPRAAPPGASRGGPGAMEPPPSGPGPQRAPEELPAPPPTGRAT